MLDGACRSDGGQRLHSGDFRDLSMRSAAKPPLPWCWPVRLHGKGRPLEELGSNRGWPKTRSNAHSPSAKPGTRISRPGAMRDQGALRAQIGFADCAFDRVFGHLRFGLDASRRPAGVMEADRPRAWQGWLAADGKQPSVARRLLDGVSLDCAEGLSQPCVLGRSFAGRLWQACGNTLTVQQLRTIYSLSLIKFSS